ncbi:MAG: penicillin-binding protein 1A [Pseudomonadota bacterium]
MRIISFLIRSLVLLAIALAGIVAAFFAGLVLYFSPTLPSVDGLLDVKLQTPLQIFSQEGLIIAEFGEKRRKPITYENIPPHMVQAILAAEDSAFFTHQGVDFTSLGRAIFGLVTTGHIQTGGSTITMQVAKNFFLSHERTFVRKFNEILLALQIERVLDKKEILELYLNKIYLGHRAYGIGAAADVYYGSSIQDLELAELAMIAGLPKAPSKFNPITNPERSMIRRNWILNRMFSLDMISQTELDHALSTKVTASYHGLASQIEAPHFSEMVRKYIVDEYGVEAYESGMKVHTSLSADLQKEAINSVRRGLLEYSQRHGYLGPRLRLSANTLNAPDKWRIELSKQPRVGDLFPGVVRKIDQDALIVGTENDEALEIDFKGHEWMRPYIHADRRGPTPKNWSDIFTVGDIIYVQPKLVVVEHKKNDETETNDAEPINTEEITSTDDSSTLAWQVSQLPQAQSALISLNPNNGNIVSLVGGFNFNNNQYNRVTQAKRQAGSVFKPILYTTALASGMTPASIINDAPIVYDDRSMESSWRPENAGGGFGGPTRLREALFRSRNLVSIRLLSRLGINPVVEFVEKFGLPIEDVPRNLSLALGTASFTPLELASAYAVFANGGYRVTPNFVNKIESAEGKVIFERKDEEFTLDNQVLTPDVHFLIESMLKDVITRGTAQKAKELGRGDVAGKTGTTNDQKDAWFSGYSPNLVTTVWVGFDQPTTLGANEFGGTAALPIWTQFMAHALKDLPVVERPVPENIVQAWIDPSNGYRTAEGQGIVEYFIQGSETVVAPEIPLEKSPKAVGAERSDIEALF